MILTQTSGEVFEINEVPEYEPDDELSEAE
jgi:hypothetical protein